MTASYSNAMGLRLPSVVQPDGVRDAIAPATICQANAWWLSGEHDVSQLPPRELPPGVAGYVVSCTGSVASQATVPTKSTQPIASSVIRAFRVRSFALMPAKNTEDANSTTASM
jgi:hypothetical protein